VEYRRNSVAYLQDSALAGSLDSVKALGEMHGRGIVADHSPELSLAYFLALQKARPEMASADAIRRLRDQLQPGQEARAEAKAKEIYAGCCI
ncbi:hypothetical protein KQ945_09255, partial [Bacillus subtilis subsp. subtilis]|nr:hypothetical protein [Bacillus subtilis subsp. subtilis]